MGVLVRRGMSIKEVASVIKTVLRRQTGQHSTRPNTSKTRLLFLRHTRILNMASYLITGASRGIGLAICDALAAKPSSEVSIVFAAYRTYTDDLKQLVSESNGRVEAIAMDVTQENEIKKAAVHVEKSLNGKGLDVLVNNAGILPVTAGGITKM